MLLNSDHLQDSLTSPDHLGVAFPLSLVQSSPAGRVAGVDLSSGLQEMPHHLQPLLLPQGLPDQSVSAA